MRVRVPRRKKSNWFGFFSGQNSVLYDLKQPFRELNLFSAPLPSIYKRIFTPKNSSVFDPKVAVACLCPPNRRVKAWDSLPVCINLPPRPSCLGHRKHDDFIASTGTSQVSPLPMPHALHDNDFPRGYIFMPGVVCNIGYRVCRGRKQSATLLEPPPKPSEFPGHFVYILSRKGSTSPRPQIRDSLQKGQPSLGFSPGRKSSFR